MVSCLVSLTSAVDCLQSLTRAARDRQKTRLRLPKLKIQYKDILRCCRRNGRINRAVHAYYRQSPLGGGLIIVAFRGGRAPVRPPSKYAPDYYRIIFGAFITQIMSSKDGFLFHVTASAQLSYHS